MKFYITTAIDYVNAKPHVGHAFEKVLADAIARYQRLKGKDVFFLTGVDENAQKNVQAAEKAGIPVKKFVDKNTNLFIELCKKLNVSYDEFVRTSASEHGKVVQKIVQKIIDKKDIYKSEYEGLYCTGCEAYYTEKDLIDGKCPEHDREPEHRKEEAYFFKLSKYQKQLLKIIPSYVIPESKKNEILNRVKEGLNDICISRKNAEWGIDFPNDKNFKIYVWIDALINYISGLKEKEKKFWPADVHIIGKGINWFHSVIWPAVLLSAGYKLPDKLLVHGYLTLNGSKISKSLGNVIDPLELIKKYGSDVVRYSLLRCSVFEDSDYSEEILIERNNNELANKLGNLISRVSALAEQHGIQKTENKLIKKLKIKEIEKNFENYELDKALGLIFEFIDECNKYVQEKQPWKTQDRRVLFELVDSIREISDLLVCFIPESSEKIKEVFKSDKIKKAEVLFIKIEHKSEQNINKPKPIEGIATMTDIVQYNDVRNAPKSRISEHLKNPEGQVDFPSWQKVDLRVGKIIKVEDIEGADKLFKLEIDVGKEVGKRTICAGLKQHYKKEDLKGKKIILFCNLAPRMMRGIESKGMLLAAVNSDDSKVILISPEKDIEVGSKIR